jgi:uncharacterized protein YdeI (YjbR/CyaY-like superfamily)
MTVDINDLELLDVSNRGEWRTWLEQNYRQKKEIWLVFYKRHTGKQRILYNDAVEEALCFGWIDSIVRRLDEDRYAQRFSRRNPKTPYSQANQERLKRLTAQGKVMQDVLDLLGDSLQEDFVVPADILAAVQANPEAWQNFQKFSPSYIRIRVGFIEGSRNRPEEFNKRLNYFIEMTARNKQFGFGGIDKYY